MTTRAPLRKRAPATSLLAPTTLGRTLSRHAGYLARDLMLRQVDTCGLAGQLLEAVRSGDDALAARLSLELSALDQQHPEAVLLAHAAHSYCPPHTPLRA